MRATKVNPELSSYANSPIILEQAARAKAFLEKHPLPPHLFEKQATKQQATDLCETLKAHRLRHQLTQTQLAERVGMQKEFISRIENGKVDVQLSTFLKIVEGLGLTMTVTEWLSTQKNF